MGDKNQFNSVLVDLANRYKEEYNNYQQKYENVKYEHKKAERALNKELRNLVGLKPCDTIVYNGEKYIVEDISMPFLAENEKDRIRVYLTLHKVRSNSSCLVLWSNENEAIIKL